MPEENDGGNAATGENQDAAFKTPVGTTKHHGESVPSDEKPNDEETTTQKIIKKGERWLIGIGIASLVINSFIAYVYIRQLKAMRDANTLTRQALTSNAQASDASSKQFLAQLQHNDASMGVTQILAIHAGEQAKAGKDAANAAKSAADTAKEALHLSERAYLVIGIPELKTAEGVLELPIENTGHIATGSTETYSNSAVYTMGPAMRNNTMVNGWGKIDLSPSPQVPEIQSQDSSPNC